MLEGHNSASVSNKKRGPGFASMKRHAKGWFAENAHMVVSKRMISKGVTRFELLMGPKIISLKLFFF